MTRSTMLLQNRPGRVWIGQAMDLVNLLPAPPGSSNSSQSPRLKSCLECSNYALLLGWLVTQKDHGGNVGILLLLASLCFDERYCLWKWWNDWKKNLAKWQPLIRFTAREINAINSRIRMSRITKVWVPFPLPSLTLKLARAELISGKELSSGWHRYCPWCCCMVGRKRFCIAISKWSLSSSWLDPCIQVSYTVCSLLSQQTHHRWEVRKIVGPLSS